MQCRAWHNIVVLLFQCGKWCLHGSSDHHTLRAVPPGPHAINLAEAVQAHHQVWHHTSSQGDPRCGSTMLSTVCKQSVLCLQSTPQLPEAGAAEHHRLMHRRCIIACPPAVCRASHGSFDTKVDCFLQEAQESARWQAYAHNQSQHQQSAEAEEALQRYTGAAELLGKLFQGPAHSAEACSGTCMPMS